MESTQVTVKSATQEKAQALEMVLIQGDLGKLNTEERTQYYLRVCDSLGLNSLTRPFEYIVLNGKLTLYAKRDCTDQLRSLRNVSVEIVSRERVGDLYIVTARAKLPNGRTDESIGAVYLGKLSGDSLANAVMKAETKAKRRVTLSICGLGILDEVEAEAIPLKHAQEISADKPVTMTRPRVDPPTIVTASYTEEQLNTREAIRLMLAACKEAKWSEVKVREALEFRFGRTVLADSLSVKSLFEAGVTNEEAQEIASGVNMGFEENIDGARD